MSKWFFIINPVAGKNKGLKKWMELEPILQKHNIPFEFKLTNSKGHAKEIVHKAINSGYRKIAALGGDGTNNEVINGLLSQSKVNSKKISYAFLSCGTGNDWIKTHRIPIETKKWVDNLRNEKSKLLSVGKANFINYNNPQSRYFINVAGLAYDAFVVKELEKSKFKNKLIYLYYTFKCLFKYKFQDITLESNHKKERGLFYTIHFGLGKYSGSGMQFVPHANPYANTLAMTTTKKISKLDVIVSSPKFYNGTIGSHPKAHLERANFVKLRSNVENDPILLELDGEFVGHGPLEFRLSKQKINLIC